MARVRRALSLADLGEAVDLSSTLPGTTSRTVRPVFGGSAVVHRPLRLAVLEGGTTAADGPNHPGIEVGTTEESAGGRRPVAGALALTSEGQTTCCPVVQEEVSVRSPSGEPRGAHAILDDDASGEPSCCAGEQDAPSRPASAPACC